MMRRYDATAETIGTMVWCQSCDTVVWALDADKGDLRGILNMLRIPCRLCGAVGNYDGYSANSNHMKRHGTFDGWSTMKALANAEELAWNPSMDNTWRSNEEIEGHMDLNTIDLDHDLGVRDQRGPFGEEF